MTVNTFYLLLESDQVIAWHSDSFAPENLTPTQQLVKLETVNSPNSYIGLMKSQLFDEPLPIPTPSEAYKNTQSWRRWRLKELHFEIQFTTELSESTTALQDEYDTLLLEYQANLAV